MDSRTVIAFEEVNVGLLHFEDQGAHFGRAGVLSVSVALSVSVEST